MPMWLLAVARTYLFCRCVAVHFVMCTILNLPCDLRMLCWRGRGPRRGRNPRRGTGTGEICPPRVLTGAGTGKFCPRGDGDGQPLPDGEFPVAIPSGGGGGLPVPLVS
jgi:hypothetical protein